MPDLYRDYYAEKTGRLVERLVKLRRAPGEATEAVLCSGVPANFDNRTVTQHVSVRWPDGPPETLPLDLALETWLAIWWELEAVRIENPEDSEQYVNTMRIKQARYRRPDGSEVQLDNRPIFAAFPAT